MAERNRMLLELLKKRERTKLDFGAIVIKARAIGRLAGRSKADSAPGEFSPADVRTGQAGQEQGGTGMVSGMKIRLGAGLGWLMLGCVNFRARAAPERLPCSTTARKLRQSSQLGGAGGLLCPDSE